ncbi:MAG: hypothetical protein ABIX10_12655, partial [Acidimicrobiales bacterium]
MRTRQRVGAGLLVLTLAGGIAACGSDDDDATDTTEAETTTEQPDEAATVEVTAVDYDFEGLPDSVEAGTKLSLTNTSDVELHELVAFALPDGETRSAEELFKLPESELGGLFAGEPAMVLLAPPSGGEQIPAVGDGTLSEPGQYVLFCSVPQGADPEEFLNAPPTDGPPDVEGGPPHFVQGMYADLTV